MINVFTSSRYKVNKKKIIESAQKHLQKRGLTTTSGINIVFVGSRKMKHVANKYLNKDVAKPVLSFKYDDEAETFGEIFLCYPQVVLLAAERNRTVNKMISELVDHGIDNLVNYA